MDDAQSLLNEPEPQPDAAAEAFARLAARVAGMEERFERRVEMLTRAVEHVAIEKQSIEIPDYSPTLAKMNGVLANMTARMKGIEEAPALQITPESMGDRIAAAAGAARETDRIAIKEAQELHRQTVATMSRAAGRLHDRRQQRRQLLYAIGGAIFAISLLWLIYPGWAASIGPQSWLWPERAARRTMGEPTLWDAGMRLMRAGNPEGWQIIVDAADMRQANRDTIAACERAAAKAKEPVRCTIRIER
jgi:hypothetical protein